MAMSSTYSLSENENESGCAVSSHCVTEITLGKSYCVFKNVFWRSKMHEVWCNHIYSLRCKEKPFISIDCSDTSPIHQYIDHTTCLQISVEAISHIARDSSVSLSTGSIEDITPSYFTPRPIFAL